MTTNAIRTKPNNISVAPPPPPPPPAETDSTITIKHVKIATEYKKYIIMEGHIEGLFVPHNEIKFTNDVNKFKNDNVKEDYECGVLFEVTDTGLKPIQMKCDGEIEML